VYLPVNPVCVDRWISADYLPRQVPAFRLQFTRRCDLGPRLPPRPPTEPIGPQSFPAHGTV